ncbi:MAG: flavodoxin family protein [Gallintestinimicrobium sp.]
MQTIVIYSSQTEIPSLQHRFLRRSGDSGLKILTNIGKRTRAHLSVWVDRGDCDEKTAELLSGLHGKKIALFEPAG